jgi:hypothetical protein
MFRSNKPGHLAIQFFMQANGCTVSLECRAFINEELPSVVDACFPDIKVHPPLVNLFARVSECCTTIDRTCATALCMGCSSRQ